MSDKLFSERMGFTQPKPVQIHKLDRDARTALYNAYLDMCREFSVYGNEKFEHAVATRFLKMVAHSPDDEIREEIYNTFFHHAWHRPFAFVEFLYRIFIIPAESVLYGNVSGRDSLFSAKINQALKQENVGWRFSKGLFVSVQTEEEQETIERAMAAPYDGAHEQIRRAVSLFSARPDPDYANSIKDSIGAVESICKEITGKEKFSDAVNNLGISMHPAFQRAAKQLYGFTSDDAGIRHAATGEPPLQVNQATARYMLIVCSAMVNFITDQKSDAK